MSTLKLKLFLDNIISQHMDFGDVQSKTIKHVPLVQYTVYNSDTLLNSK